MHHDNGIWVSSDDLNREEGFLQSAQQEFSVETSIEENNGQWEASRRDFLKILGFGVGAATLAACETPVKKAVPFVSKPDEIVPGVANYFASSIVDGGDYCSVLVKTREGRPIKIEGNALSSVSGGGTSARAQASVLSLYDTKRIKSAGTVAEGAVSEKSWSDVDNAIKAKLAAGNVRILANTIISPSAKAAIAEFVAKYPGTQVVSYDPVSASALLDANQSMYGVRAVPHYNFASADVIVSFGADFLGTWISPVEYAKGYAENRRTSKVKAGKMSRHYQVESFMSLTGSNADNRIAVKPSEMGVAIAYLYGKMTGQAANTNGLNDKAKKGLDQVAKDLLNARGKAIVVSGSNNLAEQMMVNRINEVTGALNTIVTFGSYSNQRQGDDKAFANLVNEMNSGAVGTVIVWGANPAFDRPDADKFKAAFAKVGTRVSFAGTMDETTALCNYSAPAHHILESWGDAEPRKGHYSLIQPTIAPLFKTRQAEHSLLEWADSAKLSRQAEQPYYEFVKANWAANMFPQQSKFGTPQAFWDISLHDGVFEAPVTANVAGTGAAPDINAITKVSGSELEIAFYETVNIGNGQFAHNPWLQEMPDPINRTVWGNTLSVSNEWDGHNKISGWKNLNDGDTVEVDVNGTKYTCTVTRSFGLAPGTLAIALGHGRTSGGCGVGYGVNVNPSASIEGGYPQYFAKVNAVSEKNGEDKSYACVQHHHTMGVQAQGIDEGKLINVDEKALGWNGFQGSLTNRSIIFPGSLKELNKLNEEMTEFHNESEHLNSQTLYPERESWFGTGVKWEMFVDLNACIGCGACQVACIAENNVPVVGKKEVNRHHEMTWLRIDRYFYGSFENPKVVYQPMMCQHCDNAPCENVCPVAATPHSMEGLNQMAYNRCIGTRYCANNCPYKVRRFNWLDYTTADVWGANEERVFHVDDMPFYADNLVRMVLNPDVTVRTRGVIEKCSFCVQRIQEGKLAAKHENREVADNDVRSACQTACPTNAIVFGNANNPKSELNKRRDNAGPLAYQVLEEINVRPGVSYTAKVHNSNEAVEA
jgi:MoCo/4Fe-4S cofactor protein with predicted Tat translocation signal